MCRHPAAAMRCERRHAAAIIKCSMKSAEFLFGFYILVQNYYFLYHSLVIRVCRTVTNKLAISISLGERVEPQKGKEQTYSSSAIGKCHTSMPHSWVGILAHKCPPAQSDHSLS